MTTGITVICLGSIGTYGHLSLASEVARIATSLKLCVDIDLLTEQQDVPTHFLVNMSGITFIDPRPQLCSRGGALNVSYEGPDIENALERHSRRVWVFSTFFDPMLVLAARNRGCYCVWMSHPIRESFWQLFLLDKYHELFHEIVILDDVIPRPDLKHLKETTHSIIPPPYYVTAPFSESKKIYCDGKVNLLVTCGGGLVNNSDTLLRGCLESIARCPDELSRLTIEVVPGAVRDLRWLDNLGFPVTISRGSLSERLCEADLMVCQSGYCTVHELIYNQKPAVIIPAPRLIDDQELRAVCLARYCYLPIVLPSQINDVGGAVSQMLQQSGKMLATCTAASDRLKEDKEWDFLADQQWRFVIQRWLNS